MKKTEERAAECPNCKEGVMMPLDVPAAACPKCGEKIVILEGERIYGERCCSREGAKRAQ